MTATCDLATPTENTGEVWRIRVSEPTRLRDYFLRLGARAEIVGARCVDVVLGEDDDSTVDAYLGSWMTINNIPALAEPMTVVAHPASTSRVRLGDLLLGKGLITEAQLAQGLAESHDSGELLGRVLLGHEWLFEDELARTLAEQLDLPYMNLRLIGVSRSAASLMPAATGLRVAAIPISFFSSGKVRVAFADPCDEQAQQAVAAHVDDFSVVVAELSDIEMAWRTVAQTMTGTNPQA